MIDVKQMRITEENSEYYKVPKIELMENAGKAVAENLKKKELKGKKVIVFASHGNNGGDGFVAARFLQQAGCNVTVLFLGEEDKFKYEAKETFAKLKKIKSIKIIKKLDQVKEYDFIIDALLGTGAYGIVREPLAGAIKKINKMKGFKVSVDVPSGLETDSGRILDFAVEPDLIVTFHDNKPGLLQYKNKVVVADIGIPKKAVNYCGPGEVKAILKKRKATAHKGENGRIMVIGGSEDYVGAPALSALAALHTGTDIVQIFAPEKVAFAINAMSPDLITKKLKGDSFLPKHVDEIVKASERFHVVVIGPGLGYSKQHEKFVKRVLREIKIFKVIDADAIKHMGNMDVSNAIITPHPKEFEYMTASTLTLDDEANGDILKSISGNNVIVLKGATDIIADKYHYKFNDTGNPGMTVGGTGDVLAGLCAGFLAQSKDMFNSAAAAAFINGKIGDYLLEKSGYGYTAMDIVKNIRMMVREIAKNSKDL